jgi:hypothetical protein
MRTVNRGQLLQEWQLTCWYHGNIGHCRRDSRQEGPPEKRLTIQEVNKEWCKERGAGIITSISFLTPNMLGVITAYISRAG